MNNTARYFALFRDQAGCESETIEWNGGTTADLFRLAAQKHPALREEGAALVAVNDEMSGWDVVLSDGDEVLFFPPVAGG